MADILAVVLRSLAAYYFLVLMTRLMGKKVISQLNFFDFIVGITIGSIAAAASIETEIPLVIPLMAVAVWAGSAIFNSWLSLRSITFRNWTEGEATLVVYRGKLLERNMARVRYSSDDLIAQLRNKGVFDLAQVEYALLETDGHLSVLEKAQFQPLTPDVLGKGVPQQELPVVVISEGKLLPHRLQSLNITRAWLLERLRQEGVADISQVVLAQVDGRGKLYFDLKEDNLENEKPAPS